MNEQNEGILEDALFSFFKISEKNYSMNLFLDSQLLGRIISLLDYQNFKISYFALKNIGNSSTQKLSPDSVINTGLFLKLTRLIDYNKESMRKEAYWTLSNLAADSSIYFSHFISANVFEKLRNTLKMIQNYCKRSHLSILQYF
ncbi:unnamed protein product [Blepharisma stoltei]|uniref:Uncharacterized protein n=1 Tax=Blepharisma stoltei TaxID=1481888 RepID=A0AAU9K6P5_9CILI|nr:unnamed protein product [Blepharisma stoltei]